MTRETETREAGADAPASSASYPFDRTDPPAYEISLWPHRSLSLSGFRWLLIGIAIGLTLPLLPFAGTPVGWGLLPFLMAALVAVYLAFVRNYRDAELHEHLRLWPDLITVERTEPKGEVLRWHANPFWVEPRIHEDAKIESYLTLRGNGREIEIGAFLSPEERVRLFDALSTALAQVKGF